MAWVATAIVGTSLVNGALSSKASKNAAKAQVAATDAASKTATETYDKQAALAEPFRQADLARQAALNQRLGVGGDNGSGNYGDLSSGFMPVNWMTEIDPGYDFRLAEGLKALDHRLSASGMNQSGAGEKAAIRYGQDYASGEYQNAFTRYQTSRNATLQPLTGNSGMTNNLIGAAGNMGTSIAGNQIDAGNAQASGYVGGANAWTNAINGGMNSYLGYNMFNGLYGGGGAPQTTQPFAGTTQQLNFMTPSTYGNPGRGGLAGGLTGSFSRLPGG